MCMLLVYIYIILLYIPTAPHCPPHMKLAEHKKGKSPLSRNMAQMRLPLWRKCIDNPVILHEDPQLPAKFLKQCTDNKNKEEVVSLLSVRFNLVLSMLFPQLTNILALKLKNFIIVL